jgi:hypothetical protein
MSLSTRLMFSPRCDAWLRLSAVNFDFYSFSEPFISTKPSMYHFYRGIFGMDTIV